MNYLQKYYPRFDCDESGNVYKDGKLIKPFKSNKHLQVLLFDKNNKRRVAGVHTVVAMKYLPFFEGCNIHHKDENPHNNCVNNLEIYTRSDHSKLHAKNGIATYNLNNANNRVLWNKGKKMDEEFSRKCREGIKRKRDPNRFNKIHPFVYDPFVYIDKG